MVRRIPSTTSGDKQPPHANRVWVRSASQQLAIVLRLVAAGEAGLTRQELLVDLTLPGMYPAKEGARHQAFERALRHLTGSRRLRDLRHGATAANATSAESPAVNYPVIYDPQTGRFRLRALVPTLRLSEEAFDTLCLLATHVSGGKGIPGGVELFAQLATALPEQLRDPFERACRGEREASEAIRMEPGIAGEQVDVALLRLLRRAHQQRHLVDFSYWPRGAVAGKETAHLGDEVIEILIGDHAYVAVWCEQAQRELDMRLDRFVAGSLRLSPVLARGKRQWRGVMVSYRLSPKLAQGEISERLEGQQVERQEDGSAIVSGRARSIFWARQILLRYGEEAIALSPPDLVEQMRQTVERMAQIYGVKEG